MGQPDLSVKGLTSFPDVAADIVNVFVYNGKQVLQETDLKPYVTNESIVKTEGKLKGLNRDNCMENIRNGTRYAIFGFENQNDIDHTMLLRIMGYDYSVYARQIEEIIAENKKNQKDAFVHKIFKGQKIKPVITFVLLYQSQEDDEMPSNLFEMIDFPEDEEVQMYIQNYKINIIHLGNLSNEQLDSFHSDFAFIAKYLNKHYNKKQLLSELKNQDTILIHPKDTLYTLASLTRDSRYLTVGDNVKEGTSKMCEIADALEKMGYDKGVTSGKYQTLISLTCRKLEKGYSAAQIAEILEEEIDVIQKICDAATPYAPNYDVEQILANLNI